MSQQRGSKSWSTAAGLAGLLFPGLGQMVRGQPVAALLVCLGSFAPALWTSLMINQRVNDQLRMPNGEMARTILDGDFLRRISELDAVPPEFLALFGLGVAIYFLGAWTAARGRTVSGSTASDRSSDSSTLA